LENGVVTDKVWAIEQGEYSDYGITALFESKEDAEAVCERLGPSDSWHGYRVEEFDLYRTGDRSLHRVITWSYTVRVLDNGGIQDWSGDQGQMHHGLSSDAPDPPNRVCAHHHGGWRVVGVGASLEQARKGATDRAAQVAALVIEGLDPLDVALTLEDRARMQEDARAMAQQLYERAQREAEETQRRKEQAEEAHQALVATLQVALFAGFDNQVSAWTPWTDGSVEVPTGCPWHEVTHIKIRRPDGVVCQVNPGRIPVEPGARVAVPAVHREDLV
jgi:hypothetical protein